MPVVFLLILLILSKIFLPLCVLGASAVRPASLKRELRITGKDKKEGISQMILFQAIEEHIFTLAFGAFHNYSVMVFAVNADPCSAGIASPAKQRPTEPGQSAAMHIHNLRGFALFTLGRNSRKGKCILFTDQTLFAPLLKSLSLGLWPKTGRK